MPAKRNNFAAIEGIAKTRSLPAPCLSVAL